MTDYTFYDKLDQLKVRLGQRIPDNILEYFLKQSNGNISHCYKLLENDGWLDQVRSPESIPPEHSVQRQQDMTPPSFLAVTPHRDDHSHYNRDISPFGFVTPTSTTPTPHHRQPSQELSPSFNQRKNFKISPPPYKLEGPQSFAPVRLNNDDQRHVMMPGGPHDYKQRHSPPLQTNAPFGKGYHDTPDFEYVRSVSHVSSTPSLHSHEFILQLQKEQLEKATTDYRNLQLNRSSSTTELKHMQEHLDSLKFQNMRYPTVSEEDIYLEETIKETLKDDIIIAKKACQRRQSWECPNCRVWVNSTLLDTCEHCNYNRQFSV